MSEHEDFMERLEGANILDGVGVPRIAPPPRQEGMTDARREPMTREALQRVTAQIRAWDKQSVAFDAAIQQIHAHDAAQREIIAKLNGQIDKLAAYILANVSGEPSKSEGAIDTAIRIIEQQAQEIERLKAALTAMTTERDEAARQILSLRHEAWGLAEQRNAAQARVGELEEKKDGAYLERNHLVAALARCFPSGIRKTAIEGWSDDWHGCVYIDLSAGQISYHYHDSQAFLFESLPAYTKLYDGHTKDDVHERLQSVNLQATLAAREEQLRLANIDQANTEAALNDVRQDAARLKEALTGALHLSDYEERKAYIERALKGA